MKDQPLSSVIGWLVGMNRLSRHFFQVTNRFDRGIRGHPPSSSKPPRLESTNSPLADWPM